MKRTGYAENGMLGGTYGTWMAVVMNLAAAAMIGVFVYCLRFGSGRQQDENI